MMATVSGTTSTTAVGGDGEGLQQLRHTIADSVTARLGNEVPGLSAHLGERYEGASDPEAQRYRSSGASFRWLAFAFSPWRMWDLHVGVVALEHRQLSVGFHISERAGTSLMAHLNLLGAEIRAPVKHQPLAVEYQANLPPFDVDATSVGTLVETIVDLCRRYARVAATVPCPAGMRDDDR